MEAIEDIVCEVISLEGKKSEMKLQNVGEVIGRIGERVHGFANVFPVPYYRKIMLDNRGKLKIKISELQ